MKLTFALMLASGLAAAAATEEQINKRFPVQGGGKLIVDVDFGSIDVKSGAATEVSVDVWRAVTRKSQADEEDFLREHAVNFSQDGNTITIRSHRTDLSNWSWNGRNRNEAKYTLVVPVQFNAQLKTAGGGVAVSDLNGEVKAGTSGGGLRFTRLHGPLDGGTSGGSIHLKDCEGALKVKTRGGSIEVGGGGGSLSGDTSGGSVRVKDFHGPAHVRTSGGGVTLENVAGKIEGTTSGGSISAVLVSPLPDDVKLSTSAGGVTIRVAENSAFNLDASTSAGSVSSDLPVVVEGKRAHDRLRGAINGGGKSVVLRTSAGSVHVKKL